MEETTDADGKKTLLGWPIGRTFRYAQPKTLEDRLAMAQRFIEAYDWTVPTFVDTMANDFNQVYAAWPDRAVVIVSSSPSVPTVALLTSVDGQGKREAVWTEYVRKRLGLSDDIPSPETTELIADSCMI